MNSVSATEKYGANLQTESQAEAPLGTDAVDHSVRKIHKETAPYLKAHKGLPRQKELRCQCQRHYGDLVHIFQNGVKWCVR